MSEINKKAPGSCIDLVFFNSLSNHDLFLPLSYPYDCAIPTWNNVQNLSVKKKINPIMINDKWREEKIIVHASSGISKLRPCQCSYLVCLYIVSRWPSRKLVQLLSYFLSWAEKPSLQQKWIMQFTLQLAHQNQIQFNQDGVDSYESRSL